MNPSVVKLMVALALLIAVNPVTGRFVDQIGTFEEQIQNGLEKFIESSDQAALNVFFSKQAKVLEMSNVNGYADFLGYVLRESYLSRLRGPALIMDRKFLRLVRSRI